MKCPICKNALKETIYGYVCKSNGEIEYELYLFNKANPKYYYEWLVFENYSIKRKNDEVICYFSYNEIILGKNEDWPFSKFSDKKYMKKIINLL